MTSGSSPSIHIYSIVSSLSLQNVVHNIVLCLLSRGGVEGRGLERKFWVSESWLESLLAVTHAFLAILPLAYLGWPLTRAALIEPALLYPGI